VSAPLGLLTRMTVVEALPEAGSEPLLAEGPPQAGCYAPLFVAVRLQLAGDARDCQGEVDRAAWGQRHPPGLAGVIVRIDNIDCAEIVVCHDVRRRGREPVLKTSFGDGKMDSRAGASP
jgi:hypothetical protein